MQANTSKSLSLLQKGANKFSSAHTVLAAHTMHDCRGRGCQQRATTPWADQRAVPYQIKSVAQATIGIAHALVINSLSWLVTIDGLFRSSEGRHPLPIGKCPLGDSAA
jgi:hypothetical protein